MHLFSLTNVRLLNNLDILISSLSSRRVSPVLILKFYVLRIRILEVDEASPYLVHRNHLCREADPAYGNQLGNMVHTLCIPSGVISWISGEGL